MTQPATSSAIQPATDRSIRQLVHTTEQPGTGILRPFPSAALPHIDPFVFLDTGAPRQLGEREIYVGPHAHRGVQPVSLLFRGRIEHRDSLGNHRSVDSGGVQWLISGAGALHEEILGGDLEGVFHMAQLWINVPAANKLDPPAHHAVTPDQVPVLRELGEGVELHLYAGELDDAVGPAPAATPVLLAHVVVSPGGRVRIPIPAGWTAALTVVDGEIDVGEARGLGPGTTPVFADDGTQVSLSSAAGGEVLLMAGQPLGEPIATGAGFVMNTPEEIAQAHADLRAGRMGQLAPSR